MPHTRSPCRTRLTKTPHAAIKRQYGPCLRRTFFTQPAENAASRPETKRNLPFRAYTLLIKVNDGRAFPSAVLPFPQGVCHEAPFLPALLRPALHGPCRLCPRLLRPRCRRQPCRFFRRLLCRRPERRHVLCLAVRLPGPPAAVDIPAQALSPRFPASTPATASRPGRTPPAASPPCRPCVPSRPKARASPASHEARPAPRPQAPCPAPRRPFRASPARCPPRQASPSASVHAASLSRLQAPRRPKGRYAPGRPWRPAPPLTSLESPFSPSGERAFPYPRNGIPPKVKFITPLDTGVFLSLC